MLKMNQTPDEVIFEEPVNRSIVFQVFLLILAILYDLSPIDIIPDIPVTGCVDDFFITVGVFLYLLERWSNDTHAALLPIFKWCKWGVIFMGISTVSLVGIAVWVIVKLFTG